MLSAIQGRASGLGGVGLFVIAALDSSFLSFPQVNDLLIIYLSTRYPQRMPFYASMTTAGSLLGCFVLYLVARKGGEYSSASASAPRVDWGMALYQRFGLLAVVVPSLLPPPTPFKIFVLMAGAAAVAPGASPWRSSSDAASATSVRSTLAVLYGESAAGSSSSTAPRSGSPWPSSRWSPVPSFWFRRSGLPAEPRG